MSSTTRMGLSIITSGLAFVGAANATDLIVNGSFEDPVGTGWVGHFKTYNYSTAYFTGLPIPASENPGTQFSWQHGSAPGAYSEPCKQTVDLTSAAPIADIDGGGAQYTFSTWLASYGRPGANPEQPYLTLQFLDADSQPVGETIFIDRVTEDGFVRFADGITTFDSDTHLHSWGKYVRNGTVPALARTAIVGITRSPNAGISGTPDTYTDLVKLDVSVGAVITPPSVGGVAGSVSGFTLSITETTVPIDPNTLALTLDGAAITPTSVTKNDLVTTVVFNRPAGNYYAPGSTHTVGVLVKDTQGRVASETRNFLIPKYIVLSATDRVVPDTSKPGFLWRVHQHSDLQSNDNERPERQLAGRLINSATGSPYDNLANPEFVGVANGAAAAADPSWAPLSFEIETVINMNQTAGGNFGAFKPDDAMPGIPSALNGIAGEITTYLDLPAGLITMGVNSDDGFRTKTGQAHDAFLGTTIGEFNGGRGAGDTIFRVLVTEPGGYAFRTVWEEGDGDANIEWFTVKDDGTKVLLNDTANGGIAAYRATTTIRKPYVSLVIPGPSLRQLNEVSSSIAIVLADGSIEAVDDASISFKLDGKVLPIVPQRDGNQVTLSYAMQGLQIPSEAHTAELTFKGIAGTTHTEKWNLRNLKKLVLPYPKILETFDDFVEDTQPDGWMAWNFTAHDADGRDITQQKSESYEDWVLVKVSSIPSVLAARPFRITPGQSIEIDGSLVENILNANPPGGTWPDWLMSGNVLFAASGYRSDTDSRGGPNKGQTQFITTKPYDLSSFKDVVITFSSIYEQNQDSMGAVEYSVDGGTSWLPVMYFLEEPDIKLNADGSVDAVRTFQDANGDTSSWVDNDVPKGGKYGDGLGAPITQALGAYVVPRVNDGQVEGKRVEVARLALAAGKSDVRLRLAAMGNDSWYFAVDNLAFYDIPAAAAGPTLSIARSGASVVLTFEGSLLESSSVDGPWTPVVGNSPLSLNSPAGTKFYRATR